jgi:hypothetical protein
MAFYIKIEKTEEDNDKATYRFTGDGGASGKFAISKESGEFELVEEMPGDIEQAVYRRASIKILREWRNGNLPEMTEWAS